ncbi:MAG: divergent PAP2 family protein [Anaerolineaceae bacterium]|nr:divergent PAP2 family protein [Anaerolineaceae bacterium]
MWKQLLSNQILWASLTAWFIAQVVKLPIDYFQTRQINWSLLLRAGGMPSSHSAFIAAATLSIGLYAGFDTPAFALSVVMTMIITYDASGIRRQAGLHAEKINTMINELLQGHPISDDNLREVLGHTTGQVVVGIVFGLVIALLFWILFA